MDSNRSGFGEQAADGRCDAFQVGGRLEHAGETAAVPVVGAGTAGRPQNFGDGLGEGGKGEKRGGERNGGGKRCGAWIEGVEVACSGYAGNGGGVGDVDG